MDNLTVNSSEGVDPALLREETVDLFSVFWALMEWWFYGPILMAVVMFLLVGTIFERRIETAIRRIIERRQTLLENQRQENQHGQQTTEGTQHSCASSEKTLDFKSSSVVSENTLDYENFLKSSSKKTLDCTSSSMVSEKYLDRNNTSVINKPMPEIEI